MPHRAQKRDANERQIIDALTALGCTVTQLDGGDGRMDLIVAEPHHHQTFSLEVKGEDGKLNTLQKKYHAWWVGRIHLVRTVDQAVAVATEYMNRRL